MIEHDNSIPLDAPEATHSLLSALDSEEECTQRDLSLKLDVSLGKVNYLLKELIHRGLISVKSFSTNPQKLKKVRYVLTKKGFTARVQLTQYFLKKKEEEYLRMKAEWDAISQKAHISHEPTQMEME